MRPSLITWIYSHIPWVRERWARQYRGVESSDVPWTPLTKPLARCRVALVTTGGLHLRTQKPFDMVDRRGDPSYRELPPRLPRGEWTITHDYYDHRDALADPNIVLPLDRLSELQAKGEIGELAPRHFSLMGHIEEPHVETLMTRTAPEIAGKLLADGVDVVVMSPA